MASPVDEAYMAQAEWVPMKSSTVRRAAYLPDFGYLYVEFKSGGTYRYWKVEPAIWEAFKLAPSKGQFVYYTIRAKGTDSVYAVVKVR